MKSLALYEAFGEAKTPKQWSDDPRCIISHLRLIGRLTAGWPTEAALVLSTQETTKRYYVFGRNKTLLGWLIDPCCMVPASVLKKRLTEGESLEEALTRPEVGRWPEVPKGQLAVEQGALFQRQVFEAFGDKRTLSEWAKDPRFGIKSHTLRARYWSGIPLEAALLFSTSDLLRWHTVNGKTMVLANWLKEVTWSMPTEELKKRLHAGEPLEEILVASEPPIGITARNKSLASRRIEARDSPRGGRQRACQVRRYAAFGESKTPKEWILDPRCVASYGTLLQRLGDGWPVEAALLISGGSIQKYYAFGKNKSLIGWLIDPRCVVPTSVLLARLAQGESLEEALTRREAGRTPEVPGERLVRLRHLPPKGRLFDAFGERRLLREWVADPRFSISYTALTNRLASGIPLEAALLFSTEDLKTNHAIGGKVQSLSRWLKGNHLVIPATELKRRLETGESLEHISAFSDPK